MKQLLSLTLVMLMAYAGFGQQKYTLSGYIKDSLSRETLIGASVSIKGESKGEGKGDARVNQKLTKCELKVN